MLADFWGRLAALIRQPTQTWVDDAGARHVQVLGGVVFSIDAAGAVKTRLWEVSSLTDRDLVHEDLVSVCPLPWRWIWLTRWEQALSMEVQAQAGQRGVVLGAKVADRYAKWVIQHFVRQVRSHCDLRQMRARIALDLKLDPLAIEVARRGNVVRHRGYVVGPAKRLFAVSPTSTAPPPGPRTRCISVPEAMAGQVCLLRSRTALAPCTFSC